MPANNVKIRKAPGPADSPGQQALQNRSGCIIHFLREKQLKSATLYQLTGLFKKGEHLLNYDEMHNGFCYSSNLTLRYLLQHFYCLLPQERAAAL